MNNQKTEINIDELLKGMAEELGETPITMEYLSKLNEKMVFEHAANKTFAMTGKHIPPKYKLLISLAISAALGAENCINTYTKVALRKGVNPEEIMETIVLSRFVKGTTVISSSTQAMQLIAEKMDE